MAYDNVIVLCDTGVWELKSGGVFPVESLSSPIFCMVKSQPYLADHVTFLEERLQCHAS